MGLIYIIKNYSSTDLFYFFLWVLISLIDKVSDG